MSNINPKYKMTVDLNVLEHLGINLYSNIAAVLTEVVANAWDADATNVEIQVADNNQSITITDNGLGMTIQDMNEKYLRVGYRRREEDAEYGSVTPRGRPVMGRKGLGKLSLFSIAEEVEVQSIKDDQQHGLLMKTKDITKAFEAGSNEYNPEPIASANLSVTQGTKIILRQLKRERLGVGIQALQKRLSRRFSILGEKYDFNVKINDTSLSHKNRGDLPTCQFIWTAGEFEPDAASIPKVVEKGSLPCRLEIWDENWKVKGWIGTARKPAQLDDEEAGNLNSIVVFSRGRLFQENILDELNDGRLYTKYLTGQLEADFLDDNQDPDIATSDRQRIQQGDERYRQVIVYVKRLLTQVEKEWGKWRADHEVAAAKKEHPALSTWLDNLPSGHRSSAAKLVAKIYSLPVDDDCDRKDLLRHSILAFERMKIRGSENELAQEIDNIPKLISLLADKDALEASLYRDIIRSRLEAVRAFQNLIEDDAKEAALQKYLFNHLWLLDPAWERATGHEVMESRLVQSGAFVEGLSEEERRGRIDIAYRSIAGKHVVVELKRYGRKMKLDELLAQGSKYENKIRKMALSDGDSTPNIEVIFVLGKHLDDKPDRIKNVMDGISPGSRVVYYESLISGALSSYSEYLQATNQMDQLDSIITALGSSPVI